MVKKQKIIRTGHSAAVTIPAQFLKEMGGKIGDMVAVRLDGRRGRIIYSFFRRRQLSLIDWKKIKNERKGKK